jgi:hypothetical protein
MITERHREKMAVCKLGRETWGEAGLFDFRLPASRAGENGFHFV